MEEEKKQIETEVKTEKKEPIKISLKTCIIIAIVVILVIAGVVIYFLNRGYGGSYQKVSYEDNISSENLKNINMKDEYEIIADYNTYNELLNQIEKSRTSSGTKISRFNSSFFNNYSLLAVQCDSMGPLTTKLLDFKENGNTAFVKIYEDAFGVTADIKVDIYFIPVSKNVLYAKIEYETPERTASYIAYKPIIYLYPTEETEVSVELINEENITCSYPKYQGKWNVIAKPNGDLIDLTTNRQLYSLYYESENKVDFKIENDGFVVKGEDTAKFLEEKLAILGLTEREVEEFIIYWLPKLEANKYNYIRFATAEEINENMPLEINPNPDTIIRILMTFKGMENPINVEEQKLETPNRTGYVAVEWGGTEI